jgi:hypothetical protein
MGHVVEPDVVRAAGCCCASFSPICIYAAGGRKEALT